MSLVRASSLASSPGDAVRKDNGAAPRLATSNFVPLSRPRFVSNLHLLARCVIDLGSNRTSLCLLVLCAILVDVNQTANLIGPHSRRRHRDQSSRCGSHPGANRTAAALRCSLSIAIPIAIL
ncbi:hypothetical protein RIF29_01906 [Crotalaria pallida]|uniref:Uncharacterized protein n=1 Tax=Crotalaria pallida TaxID=3830 RepID=A0AAN9IXT8_CROPI